MALLQGYLPDGHPLSMSRIVSTPGLRLYPYEQFAEAGDPVQLSPVRTTNAGQGFQGFWRPTG